MAITRRNAINLLSLQAGEIVELKQEQFLKNLRYVNKTFIHPYHSDESWWKYRYCIGGRDFWIDDDNLHDLLLNNRKLIDTLVLEAHEWHPSLTDAEGNPIYEDDDQTIPAYNLEVTKKHFFFIVAIRTNEFAYYDEVARNEMITKAKTEQVEKEQNQNDIIEQAYESKREDDKYSGYEPSAHWEEYPDAYERSDDELNGDFENE